MGASLLALAKFTYYGIYALVVQQLVRKYHTPTLSIKYSLYILQ